LGTRIPLLQRSRGPALTLRLQRPVTARSAAFDIEFGITSILCVSVVECSIPLAFSAIVRAMETVNHGRTLTMPKMLVNNDQPAELNSVLQTPYASTNASTTVATTSFGGTQDAGTQISVTPQIADGDQLVLDYTISISAFVGSAPSPELPPPRQENKLKSIVTIPDGYTVAVGGLEIGTESDVSSHVPLLGRIPILGALFANKTATDNKSRFFVFLRATVLRDDNFDDLKHLSVQDLADARVDDGWPVLKPRVIR
jgi:type II secretory pathway component GspD/PulD (secretin)